MSTLLPKIGSHISLISNSDIRYEGQLFTVDPIECTIALSDVHSYGTEDRPASFPVGPQDKVYDYILFRGSDIKDIKILPAKTDEKKTRSPAPRNNSAPTAIVSTPPGFGHSVNVNNAGSAGDSGNGTTLRASFSSPSSSGTSQQLTKTPQKPSSVLQKNNNAAVDNQNPLYSSDSVVGTKLLGKDAGKSAFSSAATKKCALAFQPPSPATSSSKQQNVEETPGGSSKQTAIDNPTKEVVISNKKLSLSEDKRKEDPVSTSGSGGRIKEETKQMAVANTSTKVYVGGARTDINQHKVTAAKNFSPIGQQYRNDVVMHRSRLPAHPSSSGGSGRFGYAMPEDYGMMLNNGRSQQIVPLMQHPAVVHNNDNRDDEMYARYHHYRHHRGENMMMMMPADHRNKRDYDRPLLDSPNAWHQQQQASFRAIARNNIGAAGGRGGGNWEKNNMTNRMMNRFVGESSGVVMSPHARYYPQPTMIYRPNSRPTSAGNRNKQQQQQHEDFSSEYDFEEANIKFEQLKSQFAKVKINNNNDDVVTESDSDGNKNEADAASANNGSEQSSTEAAESKVFYDKSKSFFDSISCEAFDQNKMKRGNWINDRKLNSETFGTLRSGAYRGGRGNYMGNNNNTNRDGASGEMMIRNVKNYRFGYGNRY